MQKNVTRVIRRSWNKKSAEGNGPDPLQKRPKPGLVVVQPRPAKLSDPFSDFNAAGLKRLLKVPDDEMRWYDLQKILGPFLPAGTYDESVYFLPRALDHLVAHEENALDLVTAVFWFCSQYAEKLSSDGYLDDVRTWIQVCFSFWTREFRVMHFDADACAKKGWNRRHFDCVRNSEVVCEGLGDLVRFERHRDIALRVVESLAAALDQSLAAAWFLELARSGTDVYYLPNDPALKAMLSDRNLLKSAAATVRDHCIKDEQSPTYWGDTFSKLDF
jgi:hypothetical protein